ncbi:MAG: signal peptide peptidase SppA [Planctomycetes bacterium]|nr:signal peptide peptidase SppA [Planctomycetota bacterium]
MTRSGMARVLRCVGLMLIAAGALCSPVSAAPGSRARVKLSQAAQPRSAPSAAAPAATQPAAKNADAAATPLVGWIDLSESLRDGPRPYAWANSKDDEHSLRAVLDAVRDIGRHKRYVGLVIHLDAIELPLSQIDELEKAIREVRAKGKKVLVFSEAYDLKSYLLACCADEVLLLHKGELELAGLGIEEMYFAGLLEKIGAKADFIQVGKFKGAAEPLTNIAPSPEWSQNFDALLDDLYGQVIDRIAKARGLTREQVERAFTDCWTMSDEEYVKRHLVDRLVDRDLTEASEAAFGDDFEWEEMLDSKDATQAPDSPFAILGMLFKPAKADAHRASIAVLHADGEIVSGDSEPDGGMLGNRAVGSRTMEDALADAADDDLIKGVVIRIDSPGGSALASEVIWQAVRKFGEEKPVYISVGPLAASGGYYIASAGHEVYVTPASIVGSIGVVGGKITLGGLYQKLGINITRRSRGPMGDMFNSVDPFTPDQRSKLVAAFERTYDQFIDRVSIGRGKRLADVKPVAEGRLFTGKQAVANGMADKIGGLDDAIGDLAKQLNLKPGSYDVIDLPAPMTLPEYLDKLLGGLAAGPAATGDAAAAVSAARAVLGPSAWRQAQPVISGLLQLRHERVLTLMPAVIVVR